jgi:multidrug efflux pump subunit AcrA (membrane-fusion protein)
LSQTLKRTRFFQLALLGLVAAMWLPVPQTVLAPAEVVPIDPVVITSPLNAVVESIVVQPNQSVQADEALVQFDPREWQSEWEIAEQAHLVAQAQLRTAQQSGLMDARHNARLAELEAEVRLKQSQRDLAQSRLEKTRVLAPSAGLVLLNDPAQWRGKPVAVGERILELADPNQVQIRILLPVADAIAMQPGTQVSLFLDVNPLSAYAAVVRHATFEPELTPEGILAYRVMADLSVTETLPRIGLRGTAKLYGVQVSLFYYLFRRPITTVRQTLGW